MRSIIEYLERGPSSSREIQTALELSQSSVSRMLKKLDYTIVRIKEGRSVRYAATCNAFGASDKIPLSTINAFGEPRSIAYLRPLNCGQYFLEPVSPDFSPLLLGENRSCLFDDLPYFLLDLKPQGYLGRHIAKKISQLSDRFPSDPRIWRTSQIGRYLISNGADLPGNFLLGEQLLLRIQRDPAAVYRKDYPELADKAVRGEPPGSSAGGEQPKFTAFNKNLSSHVIVKFTAKSKNEVTARWRDILITEYHAADILKTRGYPAANPSVFELGGRMFLESPRFDRIKKFGRSSMLSLDIINREFVGFGGNNWSRVMEELFNHGLVDDLDVQMTRELQYFGRLINNTDMHLGNLSLSINGDKFHLLPAYDMCSMGFAPKSGEVLPFEFDPSYQDNNLDAQRREFVHRMAYDFWKRVSKDDRISDAFKGYLNQGNPLFTCRQQN
ncbi:MAG: type II toxin-antitoxin system HipA family toxin YjjJ [Thermodesulfobacteriota bacterium]|nr:type II toxin-antitoxin system HipA family toxin YjjJ [Thermodesulfobacteriota bacterium]